MFKPSKLEQSFIKHQMKAHKGMSTLACTLCEQFRKKIGNNWVNVGGGMRFN